MTKGLLYSSPVALFLGSFSKASNSSARSPGASIVYRWPRSPASILYFFGLDLWQNPLPQFNGVAHQGLRASRRAGGAARPDDALDPPIARTITPLSSWNSSLRSVAFSQRASWSQMIAWRILAETHSLTTTVPMMISRMSDTWVQASMVKKRLLSGECG